MSNEEQEREREFNKKAEEYLSRLTTISTLDEFFQVVRDAATWALAAHREEMKRNGQ